MVSRMETHMTTMSLPELLSVSALADLFGASEPAIRRGLARGQYGPYLKVGRRLFVRRDSLDEFLREREVTPANARAS